MADAHAPVEEIPSTGRLALAGAILISGFLCPLLVPLVVASDLTTEWKAALSGLLLLGIPELFMLAAVAVLGKPGFDYLKGRLLRFFKRYAPPKVVSPTRYRIGLVLFLLPVLVGWCVPYVAHLLPAYEENRIVIAAGGDVLLLISLVVLGGDFWDKVRALFVQGSRVRFPKGE